MAADIVQNAAADAKATVAKELTFFETHPKAIAIGAGIAGLIAGFLIAHIF